VTNVQRVSKFRKDTGCVKGGWCCPPYRNFVKNDRFSPITLEISTAGRGCQNALFVM